MAGRIIVLRRMLSKIHDSRARFRVHVVTVASRRVAPVPGLVVPAALPDLAEALAALVLSAFAFAFIVI